MSGHRMSSRHHLKRYLATEQEQDDLERVMGWIHPQAHACHPPSLRMKKAIRSVLGKASELDRQFKIYYIDVIKQEYLCDQVKREFKHIQVLESKLVYPVTYLPFLSISDQLAIEQTICSLRHYLVDNDDNLRNSLVAEFETLMQDDDFESGYQIIEWLYTANAKLLRPWNLALDTIVSKISTLCDNEMRRNWEAKFLVMNTFNKFINLYWSHLAKFLHLSEDNHDFTKVLYKCFEKEFVRIRTEEIFEIVVESYQAAKTTILELRTFMSGYERLSKLVNQFLKQFKIKVLNPSVNTVEALVAFIRSVKCFVILDPRARHMHTITNFVKPFFHQRGDAVQIILYAILDLRDVDFEKMGVSPVKGLSELSHELREDPYVNINAKCQTPTPSPSKISSPHLNDSSSMDVDDKLDDGTTDLVYKQVLNQFLTWTPETNQGTRDYVGVNVKFSQRSNRTNLLDPLFELFDKKDELLSCFLKLLTLKLFKLSGYTLEPNWNECYQLIKRKVTKGDVGDGGPLSRDTADAPVSSNNEQVLLSLNKIDVMLHDLRENAKITRRLHRTSMLNGNVFPKFISSQYWSYRDDTFTKAGNRDQIKIDPVLETDILQYGGRFCELKYGRMVRLCKEKTIFEIELTVNDGEVPQVFKVDAMKYSVIEKYATGGPRAGYTPTELCELCGMDIADVQTSLTYWVNAGLLRLSSSGYYESTSETGPPPNRGTPLEASTREFLDGVVWTFIRGMLESLGTLSCAEIHEYLAATVPATIRYQETVTMLQLQGYLDYNVQSTHLLQQTPEGEYKLS